MNDKLRMSRAEFEDIHAAIVTWLVDDEDFASDAVEVLYGEHWRIVGLRINVDITDV